MYTPAPGVERRATISRLTCVCDYFCLATREWRSSLALDVARAKALETLRLLGGEVLQSEDGDVSAKFGSRLSLRLGDC
jgi:hypothetical protein